MTKANDYDTECCLYALEHSCSEVTEEELDFWSHEVCVLS
jgi:hypothetical protein